MNTQEWPELINTLLHGAWVTIALTIVSAFFGLIIGLFLALGRLSKNVFIEKYCWFYIWIFRGTPLLMQLFFIYYALPLIYPPLSLPQWPAAFIALSLNAGAYFAEIIRAGVLSIDKGQMEAAKALGMNYPQAMQKIIFPQAYRRLLPPIGNEIIALTKDTSLVATIALVDLLYATNQIATNKMLPLIFIPAAVMYLLMTTFFTYFFEKLEKKYSAYE